MRAFLIRITLVGAAVATLVMQPVNAAILQDGRQSAIEGCSACHRVTRAQKPAPPVHDSYEARDVKAPSFDVIARRYAGRPASLARIIRGPRHPMVEQQFLPSDLKAIVRYISSLHNERW